MTNRLDWEKANKRDIVRKQGSIRADSDLPRPKSLEKRPEQTKEGRALLKRLKPLYRTHLDEFARFAPDVRLACLARYKERLKDLTKVARKNATSKERDSLGRVFTLAGQQALSELEKSAADARRKMKLEDKLRLPSPTERKPRLPKANGGAGIREIAIKAKRVSGGVKISWPEVKEATAWLIAVTQDDQTTRRTLARQRRSLTYTELKPGSPAQIAVHARKGKISIARGAASIAI